MQLKLKTEALALLFGALVVLLDFGDNHMGPNIGNLDTIFGLRLWPLMDVIYPLAALLIFLAYGQAKGNGKSNLSLKAVAPLAVFLLALFLVCVDDFSDVLNLGLKFPETYWIAAMWLYPVISILAFIRFGQLNETINK